MERDPVLHSHVEDLLPETHPLAYVTLYCMGCSAMLHASNNECMTTWVETGVGNFCIACFAALPDVDALDDEMGLPR